MQMKQDTRFSITPDEMDALFRYHAITDYSFEKIKLGDILRYKDHRLVSISETINYAYLENSSNSAIRERYIEYCSDWDNLKDNPERSEETYRKLIQIMETQHYDVRTSAIVINQYDCIVDGLHRSCILLKKYGKDYEVEVVRINYDCGLRIRILYPLYKIRKMLCFRNEH